MRFATLLAAAGAVPHETGGGEAILKALVPDPGVLLQQVILFTLLAVVLYQFAWKHILHALEAREGRIKGDLDRAESARKESETVLARHEAAMDRVKVEALAILEEGKADALRLKEAILAEARAEAARVGERGRREIELAASKAVGDLQALAAALSVAMATRILGREVKVSDQDRLLQESLTEMKRQAMN
jgi:F-type H+-transporting ATPase subunit b